MAAIATGFGRAQISRVVRESRRGYQDTSGPYVAPHEYIPFSIADMWRSERRFRR